MIECVYLARGVRQRENIVKVKVAIVNKKSADLRHGHNQSQFKRILKQFLYLIYEGPAKSFVTGFGLLQCYVL